MTNDLETDIRRALDAKAHEIEVPEDLAARTLDAASLWTPTFRERFRAWRDARRAGGRMSGSSRWAFALGAVAFAGLMFGVGAYVMQPDVVKHSAKNLDSGDETMEVPRLRGPVRDQSGAASSGDAAGGQVTGVVSAGDTSIDASKRASDVDVETGDASAGNDAAAFVGQNQSFDLDVQDGDPAPAPASKTGAFPPKIIHTATMSVEVENFDRAWERANDVAAKHGGFVVNSNTEQIEDKLGRGTVAIRVPAAQFDVALDDLRELGELINMRTGGKDVATQIVDLKARIRALEAEELQLIELLGRTSSIAQILEIRDRQSSVRQDIESLKGQHEHLEDQVDFATINATVFEKGAEPPKENLTDGILSEAWGKAVRAFLNIIAGTMVFFGIMLPLAVLILAAWFIVRFFRRRRPI